MIRFVQKPHSVRMLKLIEDGLPVLSPAFEIQSPTAANAGETVTLAAAASSSEAPVLACHWDFGDGSSAEGMKVQHAFTHAGRYEVQATVTGLGDTSDHKSVPITISGEVSTQFRPADKLRAE